MKFDDSKKQLLLCKEFIKLALGNVTHELEFILGNNNIHNLNTNDSFIRILKRLKGKSIFNRNIVSDSLIIFLSKESRYSKDISRIVIEGQSAIMSYCNNENLANILNNVRFEKKQFIQKTGKENRINLNDYGVRINLKDEISISKDTATVKGLLDEWNSIAKSYRKKKTFTFIDKESISKIDISIVSNSNDLVTVSYILENNLINYVIMPDNVDSSFTNWWNNVKLNPNRKVKVFNTNIFFNNLRESRVMENKNYIYEYEVEFIGNKNKEIVNQFNQMNTNQSNQFIEDIYQNMINKMTILEQAVQNSFFVIGRSETLKALENFIKLTKIKGNSVEHVKNYFPLPVDLEHKNMVKLPIEEYNKGGTMNIRMDYAVTDKADGVRNLLYIDGKGKSYMLNREGYIVFTGLILSEYANSILDGEFIDKLSDGKFVQNYYIFDVYIIKGADLTKKKFGLENDPNGRHIHIKKFLNYYNTSDTVLIEDHKYVLQIYAKKYYISNLSSHKKSDDNQIFNVCNSILQKINLKYGGYMEEGHLYSYEIDGLIFLPLNLGVRQTTLEPKDISIGGRWYANFKWKPVHHNTIDFKIVFDKDVAYNKNLIIYEGNNKYIQGSLFVKLYKNNLFERQIAYKLLNNGETINDYNEDYLFVPLNPYLGQRGQFGDLDDLTSTIHIKLDHNGIPKATNGDIIENGSTIECLYDITQEDKFKRWTVIRNRNGKLPNALFTSYAAWNLINNPILTDNLSGKKAIQDQDIYYSEKTDVQTSASIRKFNGFVKREIIVRSLRGKTRPRVLDLACGKMGDFRKYVDTNVSSLVGMDIVPDNLMNVNNGAAVRLLQINLLKGMRYNHKVESLAKNTMLILGDCSKNISSGEAGADEMNKYYLDILYGRKKPKPKTKLHRMYNIGVNQFHCVVCNFAIHYFFNDENSLHQFLLNIKENLKDQGHFMATCLDGKTILKELKKGKGLVEGRLQNNSVKEDSKTKSKSKSKTKSKKKEDEQDKKTDKLIWSIQKNKEVEQIDFKESNYGQKIDFYFETFYKPFTENLVNIDFLREEALKYDLKLIDTKLFNEEPDSIYDMFQKQRPELWEEIDNTECLRQFVGLNRWMIFQKVDGLNKSVDEVESL